MIIAAPGRQWYSFTVFSKHVVYHQIICVICVILSYILSCLFYFNYFNGMQLLYNIVSFCFTTKWISYMYTFIPSLLSLPPTRPSHPSRPSQSMELSSLWYTEDSHQLSILYMAVYTCQFYSLNSSCHPFSHSVFTYLFSMFVCPNLSSSCS